jgi:hypothetical protein
LIFWWLVVGVGVPVPQEPLMLVAVVAVLAGFVQLLLLLLLRGQR